MRIALRTTPKPQVFTDVIPAFETAIAGLAWQAYFECYAVAFLKGGDG